MPKEYKYVVTWFKYEDDRYGFIKCMTAKQAVKVILHLLSEGIWDKINVERA